VDVIVWNMLGHHRLSPRHIVWLGRPARAMPARLARRRRPLARRPPTPLDIKSVPSEEGEALLHSSQLASERSHRAVRDEFEAVPALSPAPLFVELHLLLLLTRAARAVVTGERARARTHAVPAERGLIRPLRREEEEEDKRTLEQGAGEEEGERGERGQAAKSEVIRRSPTDARRATLRRRSPSLFQRAPPGHRQPSRGLFRPAVTQIQLGTRRRRRGGSRGFLRPREWKRARAN